MKTLRKRTFTGTTDTAVTARETANRALARKAASAGFVLLKNEDATLPLATGSRIGLYGSGAVKTIKGGTGSGDVNERDCVNIRTGLEKAGYVLTSTAWLDSYDALYTKAREDWRDSILAEIDEHSTGHDFFGVYSSHQFELPAGDMLDEAAASADGAGTAVFVVSRVAGEAKDRKTAKGDYYLSSGEQALLEQVCRCYRKVVLVINSGSIIDLGFLDALTNITAVVMMAQAGQEGGTALADALSGAVNPSGKLTDTWAYRYEDYPSSGTFSYRSGSVYKEEYFEGIYVGYRWFDTFGIPVRYGFGSGLSYTTFDIAVTVIAADAKRAAVTVKVTNTGSCAGKEVAEIYVSCPQGRLAKEFRRLAGFAKTKLLPPGESQTLEISFPLYQLASYDEASASYILEGGSYGIWAGSSLQGSELAGSLKLDREAKLVQCAHICPLQQELKEIQPDAVQLSARSAEWQRAAAALPCVCISAADINCETVSYRTLSELPDDEAGRIVNSMPEDLLIRLATGEPAAGQGSSQLGASGQTVPGAAAETTFAAAREPWNVASLVLADGPAGLRLTQNYQVRNGAVVAADFKENLEHGFFAAPVQYADSIKYHQYCTAIPVGILLAQTWDTALIREVGVMIAGEMNLFEVTLWLAPGMNIHRNPLCGRNFEYYSEDPLVAGLMAGAMTEGVQSVPGCGTTIKHFACNSQEDNRMGSDSVLSERALREIYLKGFEIAVRDAQPMSIMTSYNLINGVHAANCCDICTKAAHDEWGFAGTIMTDWGTSTNSTAGVCTAAGCMRAGNDLVMPGTNKDQDNLRASLADGSLDIRELKRCVYNTVKVALLSNQYEDTVPYSAQFKNLGSWMIVR